LKDHEAQQEETEGRAVGLKVEHILDNRSIGGVIVAMKIGRSFLELDHEFAQSQ
jgi:hypothetical protein